MPVPERNWSAVKKQRGNHHRNHRKGVCLVGSERKTAAWKAFKFPGFASGSLFSYVRKQSG